MSYRFSKICLLVFPFTLINPALILGFVVTGVLGFINPFPLYLSSMGLLCAWIIHRICCLVFPRDNSDVGSLHRLRYSSFTALIRIYIYRV